MHQPHAPGSPQAVEEHYLGHRARVIIKFRDRVELPLLSGFRPWLADQDPALLEELETLLGNFEARPLFLPEGAPRILRQVARAQAADPTYVPPRFQNYVVLSIAEEIDGMTVDAAGSLTLAQAVVAAFAGRSRLVEVAYVEPLPILPPSFDPTNDTYYDEQSYLQPVEAGGAIAATSAWDIAGGKGEGQVLVDIEQGWLLNHEDLAARAIPYDGVNLGPFDHGAGVLGIVGAVDNTVGCVGIAPEVASIRCVSQWRTTEVYSTALAIEQAIDSMDPGDVLLIEAHYDATYGGKLYKKAPMDLETATQQVTRLATAIGIIVVAAAGNGDTDLAEMRSAAGKAVLDPDSVDFYDSGAILVAASTTAASREKLSSSNHGKRIDCHAWGEKVRTLSSDGTTTSLDQYTDSFDETSAAAAIIAGVVLLVQGMAEANLGYRLGPWQMRELLRNPENGSAPVAGEEERIRWMPDLRRIIEHEALALAPDVYARDYVGDVGDPHEEASSSSPDIIVRRAAVPDPDAAFGEGSGTENDPTLSESVERGHDHFIYVRARNRGGSEATDVKATLYWAEPATLLLPHDWTEVGTTTIPAIPTGSVLTVSDPIPWPAAAIPAEGHYCFVAVLGTAADPAPLPAELFDWDTFLAYVRRNNNVAWRNFNVVTAEEAAAGLAFSMVGAPDAARFMRLEIGGTLPRGSRVALEMSRDLARRMSLRRTTSAAAAPDRIRFPLHPRSRTRLPEIPLGSKSREPMRLFVALPDAVQRAAYEVHVRQVHEDREVGRVTWRLVPPDAPRS